VRWLGHLQLGGLPWRDGSLRTVPPVRWLGHLQLGGLPWRDGNQIGLGVTPEAVSYDLQQGKLIHAVCVEGSGSEEEQAVEEGLQVRS
jgi:hypothetical protein